ncbi:amino acid transporter 1, putative [Trypanosoma brucei gambiense DAL972]|uniref:Amino acid transporter 1, putative n=1 Tax=Trypanosoma brucei gambiense (strain MHOM/CI/86/DAL972) TaxID=679716 RepID=C9ZWQ9_TRYB9|nr:amino acid transporter 1, putative [Trypanosoma brucei gambiense DAL972]CBH13848.1 amino acid transporter 1, putative [Trypanosoma brucei gambiense DAL972]|eukprot:XP_011776124.1 amino acid transporter 1, putative [Trypanosoma brucei gambiense DAL972]
MTSINAQPPNSATYPQDDHGSAEVVNLNAEVERPQPEERKDGGGCFARVSLFMATIIPPGGIAASAFNIGSTTVGAGIFGLPAAANSSGLVMAMIYLIIITAMTIFSIYALGVAAERTNIRTYEGVARALLGPWGAYYTAATRAFFSFSACVAYVISVGDILSATLKGTNAPDFLKQKSGNRLLTSLMWLCFMLPLVIPRHIDSLRHISTIAFILMIYTVVVVVVHSCMNGLPENIKNVSVGKNDNAEIILFNSGNRAIEGLGVIMFAYLFQVVALEVYENMTNRSVGRFVIASAIALGICFTLYVMTSFFGYLDFGRAVTGSVLLMYDPVNEPAIMVGFVGVLVKLCVSYALLGLACRNALYDVIGWDFREVAFWKHCIAVVTLSVVMLLCGLFIPKINTVLGFAGSISGGSLGFILPSLLVMYSGGFTWQKVGPFYYLTTYAVLLTGVIAIVFGTGCAIWGTFTG